MKPLQLLTPRLFIAVKILMRISIEVNDKPININVILLRLPEYLMIFKAPFTLYRITFHTGLVFTLAEKFVVFTLHVSLRIQVILSLQNWY